MTARYTTVLFDLDHTLLDTHDSELRAYAHTMSSIGLADPDQHFDRYATINRAMWDEVEAGTMQPTEVRHRRFERLVEELGELGVAMSPDADPHAMAAEFVWAFGAFGELYDGARDVLAATRERAERTALVTNGLSEVQRVRVARLDLEPYFDAIVISAEIGVSKPRPEIFDIAFEQMGSPDRGTAVMVGDSLSSDMRGAADYGIATAWFSPNGAAVPDDPRIDHHLRRLDEILNLI